MVKINGYCNKNRNKCCKTPSKRVFQKTSQATRSLTGDKVADKITSVGKTKSKEKENERQEIYIPPEKREQITDDFKFF